MFFLNFFNRLLFWYCKILVVLTLLFEVNYLFVQLDDEIEQLMSLESGMRRKEHVLELSRLMVRAESNEHRLLLLRVLQVSVLGRTVCNSLRNHAEFWLKFEKSRLDKMLCE